MYNNKQASKWVSEWAKWRNWSLADNNPLNDDMMKGERRIVQTIVPSNFHLEVFLEVSVVLLVDSLDECIINK